MQATQSHKALSEIDHAIADRGLIAALTEPGMPVGRALGNSPCGTLVELRVSYFILFIHGILRMIGNRNCICEIG
jgi:hypothetical protein